MTLRGRNTNPQGDYRPKAGRGGARLLAALGVTALGSSVALLAASPAYALGPEVLYVSQDATSAGSGGCDAPNYLTITDALSAASVDDIIKVCSSSGPYMPAGTLGITQGGLTLEAADPQNPPTINLTASAALSIQSNGVSVQNLRIVAAGTGIDVQSGVDGTVIASNAIDAATVGVNIEHGRDGVVVGETTVVGNTFSGVGEAVTADFGTGKSGGTPGTTSGTTIRLNSFHTRVAIDAWRITSSEHLDAADNWWGTSSGIGTAGAATVTGDSSSLVTTSNPLRTDLAGSVSSTIGSVGVPVVVDGISTAVTGTGGVLTAVAFTGNPTASAEPATGPFFGVALSRGTGVTQATIADTSPRASALRWFDGSAWTPVGASPLTVTTTSIPNLSQLTPGIFAAERTVPAPPPPANPPTESSEPDIPERVGSTDRYGTANLLAALFGPSDTAVIASGIDQKQGIDALAANYLAGQRDAPILLSSATGLSPATLDAVVKVLKGSANPTVYLMGGEDSVPASVRSALEKAIPGVKVIRVAGTNRYDTAAKAAEAQGKAPVMTIGPGKTGRTAILVSGVVNADALAAGPVAFAESLPILLADGNGLPAPTVAALTKLGITQLIVVGGTDRVSDAALRAAAAAGVKNTVRIAGANRYETSVLLAKFASSVLTNADGEHYGSADGGVFLANGATGFADALAAGPVAGSHGATLLLASPSGLPSGVAAYLGASGSGTVTALGSAGTVSDSVLTAAKDAME